MQRTIRQLALAAAVLLLGLAQPFSGSAMNLSPRPAPAAGLRVATTPPDYSSADKGAIASEQSGYWAQVSAHDATVRNRAGGSVVLITLTRGQFFHVYNVDRRSPAWFVGYACPHGNRGCGSGQSIPGYILRSALSGRSGMDAAQPSPFGDISPGAYAAARSWQARSLALVAASFQPATGANLPVARGSDRRVCAKDVYLRDNKLHPIAVLRRGDRFRVETYTDGSGNDGRARWAIGVGPGNVRGRVLVSALCP